MSLQFCFYRKGMLEEITLYLSDLLRQYLIIGLQNSILPVTSQLNHFITVSASASLLNNLSFLTIGAVKHPSTRVVNITMNKVVVINTSL